MRLKYKSQRKAQQKFFCLQKLRTEIDVLIKNSGQLFEEDFDAKQLNEITKEVYSYAFKK